LALCALLSCLSLKAAGVWRAVLRDPPAGVSSGVLLGDGTVICADGGTGWYRLTPDTSGNFANGTWTTLAKMHDSRLFCATQVLTNGNVFECGGEYGSGHGKAEIYDPLANVWTELPLPGIGYSDAESKMLPNGNVLMEHDVYSVVSNLWVPVNSLQGQGEACWAKLPDDSVLTVDGGATTAERFIPAQNKWILDATCPVQLYGYGSEEGAAHLLPNGKVFFIGGTVNTAVYTPSGTTAQGHWAVGPTMVFGGTGLGAVDAPSTLLNNGKVLCALGPTNGYDGPTSFYEYDGTNNNFTQINGPAGLTYNNAPYGSSMVNLPDGNVLFIGGQGTTSLYVYSPDGTPITNGQAVINSITENADGSYHLTGTGLNGISGGAAYGDDFQMDSNYPLLRMTNTSTGQVYYARAHHWNNTGVATGAKVVTTEFTLPVNLPAGTYSVVVSANGIASLPVPFTNGVISAPSGFSAVSGQHAQVTLYWNPVDGATSYNLKRYTSNGGPYFSLFVNLTGTNYTDTNLVNGMNYFYVVTAVGNGSLSPNSAEVSGVPTGEPPVPVGLHATAGSDQVTLSWTVSFGATSYDLQRATTNGGPYTHIASPPGTSYTDSGLVNGATYYYVLAAVNSHGSSSNCLQVSATPSTVLNSLIGYWKFDEGSGVITADSSVNNNTGFLSGGPTWLIPGKVGPAALQFNAAQFQSVAVFDAAGLDPSRGGLSITAWINAANWAGNRRVLQKGNNDNQYRLLAEGGVFKFDLTGVGTVTTALPPTANWVHVAGTWNGSTMAIYYNGVLKASLTASGSLSNTTDPLAIAAKNGSGTAGDYFQGSLDDVRVYNRGLSFSDIAIVMAPLLQVPTGLTATASNMQAQLTWNASPGAFSYNLKRSTTNDSGFALITNLTGTSYIDSGLTNNLTYYYVVSSVNAGGESADSPAVSATSLGPPTLAAATVANGQFSFQFLGADGQSYIIQTSVDLITWTPLFTNTPTGGLFTFTDTNLFGNYRYYRIVQ